MTAKPQTEMVKKPAMSVNSKLRSPGGQSAVLLRRSVDMSVVGWFIAVIGSQLRQLPCSIRRRALLPPSIAPLTALSLKLAPCPPESSNIWFSPRKGGYQFLSSRKLYFFGIDIRNHFLRSESTHGQSSFQWQEVFFFRLASAVESANPSNFKLSVELYQLVIMVIVFHEISCVHKVLVPIGVGPRTDARRGESRFLVKQEGGLMTNGEVHVVLEKWVSLAEWSW